jgi:hypothetical protein
MEAATVRESVPCLFSANQQADQPFFLCSFLFKSG